MPVSCVRTALALWGGLLVSPYLASLVLRDLVLRVLLAVLALAVGAAGLGNVDLARKMLLADLHVLFALPPVCDI